MSHKMTRTLKFAEEMVRACLPYADRRRVGSTYPIEMVDVLRTTGEKINREVKLRVYPRGRDRLIATCSYLTYNDRDWVGICRLETETGDHGVAYECSISGDGERIDVMPVAGGPGTRYTSLPQTQMHAFLDRLPLLRNDTHAWDIWPIDARHASGEQHYGAWRMSWIIGECLEGTMDQVALAIAQYELAHCPIDSMLEEKWEETVAKLSPVTV